MKGLPIAPPYPPMEALLVDEIPEGAGWQYEPKWDGFRCLVFRDGDKVELQSKSGQPLARYFPEVVENIRTLKPSSFILDGEIVIPVGKELSFDDLLQRIHPAESLVRKLAKEIPATLIVFDLLADEKGKPLVGETLALRRLKLETSAEKYFRSGSAVVLSPATTDAAAAKTWPSLVVEVRYDHFSQGRFRHGTKLLRRRPDKAPKQCTMDQVERKRNVSAFSLT